MSIEIGKDQLLSMGQVAALLPPAPGGRKKAASTVLRWTTQGKDGVVLESVKLGSATYTTAAALSRFSEACRRSGKTTPLRSRRQREKARRDAGRKLDAAGVK